MISALLWATRRVRKRERVHMGKTHSSWSINTAPASHLLSNLWGATLYTASPPISPSYTPPPSRSSLFQPCYLSYLAFRNWLCITRVTWGSLYSVNPGECISSAWFHYCPSDAPYAGGSKLLRMILSLWWKERSCSAVCYLRWNWSLLCWTLCCVAGVDLEHNRLVLKHSRASHLFPVSPPTDYLMGFSTLTSGFSVVWVHAPEVCVFACIIACVHPVENMTSGFFSFLLHFVFVCLCYPAALSFCLLVANKWCR